jgi:transcriptional regulator with XRE-family HTH domain
MQQPSPGEQAGVDIRTVQRLERGEPAQLPTIRKLAQALDVMPADLMREPRSEGMNPTTDERE